MRHGNSGRKFSRTKEQRRALLSGLASSLIEYEQIQTTLPKAKDLRPYVEKLITIAKKGDVPSRRRLISVLHSEVLAEKLISTLSSRYKERSGGYTRIIKSGFRYGDASPMAYIEFVDRDLAAKGAPVKEVTEETASL
jgi:large subunit ribosomal protein L17